MKLTIEIPRKIVKQFISDFRALNDRKPTEEEMKEFFAEDIVRVYENIAELEGFIDAIG